eukprot:gene4352-336_t
MTVVTPRTPGRIGGDKVVDEKAKEFVCVLLLSLFDVELAH